MRKITTTRTDLTPKLVESVFRARMDKLEERMEVLAMGQTSGRLGPRVIRARVHFLEKERRALAAEMRKYGYEVD